MHAGRVYFLHCFPQNLILHHLADCDSLSPAVSRAHLAVWAKNLTDTLGLDYRLGLQRYQSLPSRKNPSVPLPSAWPGSPEEILSVIQWGKSTLKSLIPPESPRTNCVMFHPSQPTSKHIYIHPNGERRGRRTFCKLTQKLASPWFPRHKAEGSFQFDFGLLQKIISVDNTSFSNAHVLFSSQTIMRPTPLLRFTVARGRK